MRTHRKKGCQVTDIVEFIVTVVGGSAEAVVVGDVSCNTPYRRSRVDYLCPVDNFSEDVGGGAQATGPAKPSGVGTIQVD